MDGEHRHSCPRKKQEYGKYVIFRVALLHKMLYSPRIVYVFLRHIVTQSLQCLCGRGIEGVTEM